MAKKKTNLSRVIPRLLSYIILRHKLIFGIVVICILISSCTVVASSLFLEILIDNYIEPLLLENTPVFSGLLHTVLFMAVVYMADRQESHQHLRHAEIAQTPRKHGNHGDHAVFDGSRPSSCSP